jgi:asparagine synthase (glutamine-hydrolysing)
LKKEKLDLFNIYPVSRRLYSDKQVKKIIANYHFENKVFELTNALNDAFQLDSIPYQSRVSLMEMYSYMQHVLLRDADQMSMAHALEVRVPFLDHELVEFMLGVKDEFKLEGYPKKLLVDSLGDLLPKEVYDRTKMGFVFPWESWIRNELYDFCAEKISYLSSLSAFNERELNDILKQFNNGNKRINWVMIWTLVVLATWMQENNIDE